CPTCTERSASDTSKRVATEPVSSIRVGSSSDALDTHAETRSGSRQLDPFRRDALRARQPDPRRDQFTTARVGVTEMTGGTMRVVQAIAFACVLLGIGS